MWGWLYATRLPAIVRARMRMDPTLPRGAQMAELPARVRWKADNYNHLMEQPTVFYAVALAMALMGDTSMIDIWLAWAYVAIRVVHSLWQALINDIPKRFALFTLSAVALVALTVRALMLLLG